MADGSADPAVVAKAESLIKAAAEKLATADTVRAVYLEVDAYPGEYRDLRQTGTITLAKPGSIRLEIVRARRVRSSDPWKDSGNNTLDVSNGTDSYAVFLHPHSTQVRRVAAGEAPSLSGVPLLAEFFGGPNSLTAQLEKAKSGGQVEVSGATVRFREGETERTVELGLDGLAHRLVVHNDRTQVTRTWELKSITLNSHLTPSAFRYIAPHDALPYPTAERSSGIEVGEVAPDFEVPSTANKPARLSDFKGKVVVLEFWATWCWPCNQSIPETQRLVSAYRDRGVEGFLVSIKDSRKGFDAWIHNHPQYRQLEFGFDDPVHGPAEEAFLHPTNPTLYVIGRDGRVVARFVGYTGPNPAVEEAIKSAL